MPRELYVRDGGTFRRTNRLYVREAGVWREVNRAYIRDGGIWREAFTKVTAGSALYTSPGSYSLTIPAFRTLVVQVWGAGGGGGSDFTAFVGVASGAPGGDSYVTVPTYGNTYAYGGRGGFEVVGETGAPGGAFGGNVSNISGGGSAGGAPLIPGFILGGGNGGFSQSNFTFGVTSGSPDRGAVLTIVVGAGGAGGVNGGGATSGLPGANGQCQVSWF
jgi:hypothetical protein